MTHAQAAVQKLDASVKSGAPAKEQEQAAEDAVNSVAVLVALISKLQSEMSQSMSKVMDRSAKDQLNKALKQAEKEIKQAEADLKAAKETEKSAHSGGFLKLLGAIFAIAVVALSCVAACFVGPMAIGVGLLVAGAIMAGTQAGAEMIQGKHTGKAAEYQAESAQDKIDAEKIANDIAHDKYVLDRIMDSFRRLLDDVSNNASAIQNILQVKQQSDSKLAGGG